MALPDGYVKEAKSFIVDHSLFRRGDVMRCLCGYTGDRMDDWLHFGAVVLHSPDYKAGDPITPKDLEPPVNAVRIYICPRCGTTKLSVYDTGDSFTINRHPVDLGYVKKKVNSKRKKTAPKN
ncbi:MAG: hypothetical protein FWD14_07635 [Treponema sp.]|nr:hypothetical protein [Treponema sp.]